MAETRIERRDSGGLRDWLLGPRYEQVPSRDRLEGLTAASMRLAGRKIDRGRVSPEAWQQEAIELYSEVGELRYLANATANAASRAHIYVGKWDPESSEPVEVVDPLVRAIWDHLGGGTLGRSEMVKRLFIQLFVPGDGYLIGIPPGYLDDAQRIDPQLLRIGDLSWHVLSATEVTVAQGLLSIDRGDGVVKMPAEQAVIVRAWRPNPFRWWQADSPVRSNLPVLRELVGLTKHVSATIDSRLAGAGMLLIGESFSVLSGQSPDADDAADPVMAALMDAMLTAIKDRDAASAVVPIILQGPDDAIDKVQHLNFSTPFDAGTKDLRDEAIRRLALGLDAPPEVLLGIGTSNHWNAWIIQDDVVRTHIDPALALICDALTTDYLWPMLEDNGVADPHSYAVWWDASVLTQRADRSAEAIQLFGLGTITAEALRRETGFEETDAPEEDDPALTMALRLVEASPSLISEPGLPAVVAQLRAALEGPTGDLTVTMPAQEEAPEEIVEPAGEVPDMPDEDGITASTYQEGVRVGSYVSWSWSGGTAQGQVERIVRDGSLEVPGSDAVINADPDDPAVLIESWSRVELEDGVFYEPTGTMVGRRSSALTPISALRKRPESASITAQAIYPDDAPGGGLPDAYRPALADDVPEGRACGNCAFYDESVTQGDRQAWCSWWEDWVEGDHYCDAWKAVEEDEDADGDERP
jgi:hypothetical protein